MELKIPANGVVVCCLSLWLPLTSLRDDAWDSLMLVLVIGGSGVDDINNGLLEGLSGNCSISTNMLLVSGAKNTFILSENCSFAILTCCGFTELEILRGDVDVVIGLESTVNVNGLNKLGEGDVAEATKSFL